MRKLFALLFVAGTLAFTSCGEKKAEESATTTDSVATAPAPEAAPADTMAAAPMDSAKTDTAAAK